MPTWVGTHLAEAYADLLDDLANRFGGHAAFWQFCARKLRSGEVVEEEIPYPFYEVWREEWIAEQGEPDFQSQSGPLSEIQIANPRRLARIRARKEAAGRPVSPAPNPCVLPAGVSTVCPC